MNEQKMRKKIHETLLFSDTQKAELYLLWEQASEADKRKLIEGIDAFDQAYSQAMAKHSADILGALDTVKKELTHQETKVNKDALDAIRVGATLLAS